MDFRGVLSSLALFFTRMLMEVKYFLIGGHSIIEDTLHRVNNKCEIYDKAGCIAVVTGGSRGIGLKIVKKLLQCNMTVVIGCRNPEAGLREINKIRKEGVSSGFTFVEALDLCSFSSIREFSQIVLRRYDHLDLLVNNAGIMFPPYKETADGYESQWGVNYLGHFLLTHLLFPLLSKTKGNARVVNVTSCAYLAVPSLDLSLKFDKDTFVTGIAYAQSKRAQLLFSIELDRRLREAKSNVYVLAVHPGIVNTDLFDGTPLKTLCPWVLKLCKDANAGAETVLYPCISMDLEGKGGLYTKNCSVSSPVSLKEDFKNETLSKLFDLSLSSIGVDSFF